MPPKIHPTKSPFLRSAQPDIRRKRRNPDDATNGRPHRDASSGRHADLLVGLGDLLLVAECFHSHGRMEVLKNWLVDFHGKSDVNLPESVFDIDQPIADDSLGGSIVMGVSQKWLVDFMENPDLLLG